MPRKARPSRRSGSSSSGPSLAELENNFVIACGIGSQARILAAVEFVALGTLLSSDQSELRRYEAKNLPEVCIAETFSPFLVLAKYLAIRGLTKVLIFKTQENMVTMMAECDDSVDIENKIENANNNSIFYVLNACNSVLKIKNQPDPYKMESQIIESSLQIIMQGLPRFVSLTRSMKAPSISDNLLEFIQMPSVKVIVSLSSLFIHLGKHLHRRLHDIYAEGLGIALINLLSSSNNGTFTLVYQQACDFLIQCKEEESRSAQERDQSIKVEQEYAAALKYALKESKKGQKILRERFQQATIEHREKEITMNSKINAWKVCNQLRLKTEKAMSKIEKSLCSIMDAIGLLCFHVIDAKTQCIENGIIDTLLNLVFEVDNGRTDSQHGTTFVRMFAARCLGNICNEFVPGQKIVDVGGGNRSLLALFNYEKESDIVDANATAEIVDTIDATVEHDTKEAAATALVQCSGHFNPAITELLNLNAVRHLFLYVQRCLKSSLTANSSSSAAAASAIAHLTSNFSGLDIIGGKKVLPILLAVMANGTDSSSHAARIIGNAFSGAPPSTFQCLVECGGLQNITAFIIFITKKTLNQINTISQLKVLTEVLRAGEMTISGMKSSQDEVIKRGILEPLKALAFWMLDSNTDENYIKHHGDVQAAALSCIFAVVVNNDVGLEKIIKRKIIDSFLYTFNISCYPPAQTNFCRLFAIFASSDPISQNLLSGAGVFKSLCSNCKNCSQSPTPLRAAITWACREGFHNNSNLLQQSRELGLFEAILDIAWRSMDVPEVTTEIALLLRSASRSAENRELIREIGGIHFCCQILCRSNPTINMSASGLKVIKEEEQRLLKEKLQVQKLKAACRAVVAVCYCEERNIDALSKDNNVVEATISMLSTRGGDLNTLHLCVIVIPMFSRRGKQIVEQFIQQHGMFWLCKRLEELIIKNFEAKNQHYKILKKALIAVGTLCIRCEMAQKSVRVNSGLKHITKVLKHVKDGIIPRKDILKWESIVVACCDSLGHICKGSLLNQKEMLTIGGNSLLFYILGDSDLRNTSVRGSAKDCVRGVASGWGDAEDALNIVLL